MVITSRPNIKRTEKLVERSGLYMCQGADYGIGSRCAFGCGSQVIAKGGNTEDYCRAVGGIAGSEMVGIISVWQTDSE